MLKRTLCHCSLQAIIFINIWEMDLNGWLIKFSNGLKLDEVNILDVDQLTNALDILQ